MPTLTLKTTVADDRHLALNLTLPPDFPTGNIEIVVRAETVPATDNALPNGSRLAPVAELLESWRRNPLPEAEMQALAEFDAFRHEHPVRFRMLEDCL
ncbi:MAG: hypothetical protein LM550_00420 [Candidatus Contendobacter sp.]|jgi:hypothetical protein|nr:hypothetical protein [Gammaproteobacteria bacterium]MCC8992172.1 hypothetical protein [Candidatus Contendobacter sp.]